MSARIIIEKSDGWIIAIYSDDKDIEVDILNHDDWEASDCDPEDAAHYKNLDNDTKDEKFKVVF